MTLGGRGTRKYLAGVITILVLAFASVGSGAGLPSTADTGPTVTSQAASTASGQCSKAEAIEAVRRLGLARSDVSADYPVWKVLCGAFTGGGGQTMVVSINGPDNVGMLYWAVFRWSGSEWQLLMRQRQAAILTSVGSDIRETVSIYRPSDPRCCPSGGTRGRVWHWNGSRFVAGHSEQMSSGEAGQTPLRFDSPSRNINCFMYDGGSSDYIRGVTCKTDTPRRLVAMSADGRLSIRGFPAGCGCDEPDSPPLSYGKQVTVGRYRCLSLQAGVRCTVIQTGKGFLINRDGVSRVGP